MKSSRSALLGCLVMAACARSVLSPPRPQVIDTGWVLHEIRKPDCSCRPPEFVSNGGSGCYRGHTQDTLAHGPGWRAFCLGLHPLGQPIPLFQDGISPPDCQADCLRFDRVRTTQMTLGGQDVIVQTAYVPGGFAGRPRSPEMLVRSRSRAGWHSSARSTVTARTPP